MTIGESLRPVESSAMIVVDDNDASFVCDVTFLLIFNIIRGDCWLSFSEELLNGLPGAVIISKGLSIGFGIGLNVIFGVFTEVDDVDVSALTESVYSFGFTTDFIVTFGMPLESSLAIVLRIVSFGNGDSLRSLSA